MEQYKTVENAAMAEFVERRSRFIGAICPVSTEEEALAFIAQRKTEHKQATHNCWAYQLKGAIIQRYNDDGEPQGTAGMPILDVLRKEEIVDAAIVVTRYFGGVLLGAGGLIRAYSEGAKTALDAGGRITMAQCILLTIPLSYPLYDKFLSLTEPYPMMIVHTDYGEGITLHLCLQADYLDIFLQMITQLSSGTIQPVMTGETFAQISK